MLCIDCYDCRSGVWDEDYYGLIYLPLLIHKVPPVAATFCRILSMQLISLVGLIHATDHICCHICRQYLPSYLWYDNWYSKGKFRVIKTLRITVYYG